MIIEKKNNNLDMRGDIEQSDYLKDLFVQDYYSHYYDNLSLKDLDREFNKDLKILTKSLKNLPESKRKIFIDLFSRFIENNIEKKIEKQLDNSLYKVF